MIAIISSVLIGLCVCCLSSLQSSYTALALVISAWGCICILFPVRFKSFWGLFATALLMRLLFVFHSPALSDDLFRALWEGKLTVSGGNPYLTAPSSFSVFDGVREHVNHPDVPSVYPPFAQWFWALCVWISYQPLSLKLLTMLIEVSGVWALADICRLQKRSLSPAWILALHPLVLIEGAGNAHIDAVAVTMLMWACWSEIRGRSGAGWLVLGGGLKLLPLALLLNSRRGVSVGFGLTLLLCAAWPLLAPGMLQGLQTYAEHWSFQGGVFPLLTLVISPVNARIACVILWLLMVVIVAVKKMRLSQAALWLGGAFLLLSPTVHPWYGLWILIPALLEGWWSWLIFASLLPLSYSALSTVDALTGSWSPPIWPALISYIALLVFLLLESVWRAQRPGPSAVGDAQIAFRWLFRTQPDQ